LGNVLVEINVLIVRVSTIEDPWATVIVATVRRARTCAVANTEKIGSISIGRLSGRCRRSP